ncbi:activity-regulated cytoskeleton associated protein 2-like [Colletes gigas]|uniref:activity-regulated cytoskeleton associated protein 2-like n=1 Tax=Colletes gigas TaxID=935657 RepID=UPI001C9AF648|nr:activity-regulated cytoskeleton associated protein 2-like [Colletes gigas]
MTVEMDDQLNRLLATLTTRQTSPPTTSQGSFERCTTRFGGSTNRTRVEEFISTISIYKEIENISDVNGIKGLPLLLEDEAATWWHGVKEDVTTWAQAMDLLRAAYAPRSPDTPCTQNYSQQSRQRTVRLTYLFAELTHKHAEEIQLDMI